MYLYCGKRYKLFKQHSQSKTAILNQKYAGLGYHSPNMENGLSLGWQRSATVYDQEALVCLLQSGKYIGYLPDHYAKSFVDDGQIRAIATDEFYYACEYAAITRTTPEPGRIVDTFVSLLKKAH